MTKAKKRAKAFVTIIRALEGLDDVWEEKKNVVQQVKEFYGVP